MKMINSINAAICTNYGNLHQYDNALIYIRIIIVMKMVRHYAAYSPIIGDAFRLRCLVEKYN